MTCFFADKKWFILILTLFFLSGCASMKKEECLNADWYNIGFEDGTRGHKVSRIGKHRKACAKYDVSPDLEQYSRGRDQGLIDYCTPYSGYQLGLQGSEYNDVCHGHLKTGFHEAYKFGKDIYLFKRKIKKKTAELDRLKDRMADLNSRIEAKENELAKGCSDSKACKKILDEIREMDSEKADLRFEIEAVQSRVSDMKRTLAEMKSHYQF